MSAIEIVGSTIRGFCIESVIGNGGMATVYRGVRDDINRVAAIKILEAKFSGDAEFVRRLRDEARAVNLVNHPDVVKIDDLGVLDSGQPFIVMEFIPGQSLRDLLNKEGPLPLLATLRIGCRIARAMAAVHKHGVIHRDLKPGNIMVVVGSNANDSDIKILDFGIAKVPPPDSSSESHPATATNVFLFTVHYAGPEHFLRGSRSVTAQVDVYALGVMLYEMLSGKRPYQGGFEAVLTQVSTGQPPTPLREVCPEVPREVAELIHSLMLREPTARPTMEQAAAQLEGLIAATVAAQQPQTPPGAGPALWQRLALLGAVSTAALMLILIALHFIKPGQPEPRPSPPPSPSLGVDLARPNAQAPAPDLTPPVEQAEATAADRAAPAAVPMQKADKNEESGKKQGEKRPPSPSSIMPRRIRSPNPSLVESPHAPAAR